MHIDVKCGCSLQLLEEGLLKILFAQSADDLWEEFTKNVSSEVHDAHMPQHLAPRKCRGFGLTNEVAVEEQGNETIIASHQSEPHGLQWHICTFDGM